MRQIRILEALQTLSPQRRALLLLQMEGWSVGEITAAFSCSRKRVENELYRARCVLAAWRQKEAETGGPE